MKTGPLGSGTYGKIYKAQDIRTGETVVVKEVDMTRLEQYQKDQAIKEVKFMRTLHHPNIVSYRDYFLVQGEMVTTLYIVMEFAAGGDLGKVIKEAKKSPPGFRFSETEIIDWMVQMCLALKHCHNRKIIHRDIKTDNMFLSDSKEIKLGDFGVSRNLIDTLDTAGTQVGTPYYLSPEICRNQPYDSRTDVWSMGAVVYELMTLCHPFEAKNLQALVMSILREKPAPLPDFYSQGLRDAVMLCLNKDYQERPTIEDILRLPLLRNRIPNNLSESLITEEFSHTMLHGQNLLASLSKDVTKSGDLWRSPSPSGNRGQTRAPSSDRKKAKAHSLSPAARPPRDARREEAATEESVKLATPPRHVPRNANSKRSTNARGSPAPTTATTSPTPTNPSTPSTHNGRASPGPGSLDSKVAELSLADASSRVLAPLRPTSRDSVSQGGSSSRPNSNSKSRPNSQGARDISSPSALGSITRRMHTLPRGAGACERCSNPLRDYIYQCTANQCRNFFLCRSCYSKTSHGVDSTPPHTFEQLFFRPGEANESPGSRAGKASPLSRSPALKPLKPIAWPN